MLFSLAGAVTHPCSQPIMQFVSHSILGALSTKRTELGVQQTIVLGVCIQKLKKKVSNHHTVMHMNHYPNTLT